MTQKEYVNVPTPPLSTMNFRELVLEKRYEMLEMLEWIGMVEVEADRYALFISMISRNVNQTED
jgi:hypothetical protein